MQVYFLDRTHQEWLHPSANRIPVLVLDYDQVRQISPTMDQHVLLVQR